MDDLISRKEAVELIRDTASGYTVSMFATSDECFAARLVATNLAVDINSMPSIEAEPVVHCKDCKYSKKFTITGNRYCEFHGAHEYPVSDDDYCSNGEKMDLEW